MIIYYCDDNNDYEDDDVVDADKKTKNKSVFTYTTNNTANISSFTTVTI